MSDQLPVYSVTVTREDGLWVAVVDGIPGGATDVEHFEDLHDAVHDLVATMQDLEPGNFWIQWSFRQGSYELFDALRELRQWEKQAQLAQANRDAARRAAVDAMRRAGLSYRDIADVIGISYQRVGQLLEGDRKKVDVSFGSSAVQLKRWVLQVKTLQAIASSHSHNLEDAPSPEPFYMSPLEAAIWLVLDSALQLPPLDRQSLLTTTAEALKGVAQDNDFLHAADDVSSGTP